MLAVADAHRLDQPRVDPRQVGALGDRALGDLEEVQHLPDAHPVPAARHVHHDDGALIPRQTRLLEEHMTIEHGQQGATDVHQPFDRLGHPWNPGSRQARQDLTHDPCRGRANKRTDAKNDGVQRGGVSHLY